MRRHEIRRKNRADDLHFVAKALRPEGPDGTVDHARRQRGPLARATFPLEETAGDLPGGVHPLFDVDRQRKEVRVGPRIGATYCCREDHRLARAAEDRAVCLLGELARLEDDLLTAHLDGNRGYAPGNCAHIRIPFTLPFVSGRWRFESAPGRPRARSNIHLPRAGVSA